MHYLRALFPVLLLALLGSGGCAVVSEDECRAGLWYERGLEDGAHGRSQGLVYEIAQKCREFGERVDTAAWLRGHEEGVEQYCTPENGYYQGRRGADYEGVCTGPTADLFMGEYQRGLQVYQVEVEYRRLADRQDRLEGEIYAVNAALQKADSEEGIRELKQRRRVLQRELRLLERELWRMRGFGYDFFF